MEELQRERYFAQQAHERMRAGLADFQAIHTSMQQLRNRAENLQLTTPPHQPPYTVIDEEEDWPPPPLDIMMNELQSLKRESLAAQESQTFPLYNPQPVHTTMAQPKITPPPMPPLRVPARPEQRPPPPSDPSWWTPPAQRPLKQVAAPEMTYRGPRPSIPKLINRDPGEFARLKMALENLLPLDSTELFKYQVLLDHLYLEEAELIADAYLHSTTPFSDTMAALNDKLGQPHQLALRRIAAVMDSPDIRKGDVVAFEKFSLQIQSLVGMLKTLGPDGEVELQCGSHVARLLSKLPPEQRADFRRCVYNRSGQTYTLNDLTRNQGRHLQVLHKVNTAPKTPAPENVPALEAGNTTGVLYLDRATESGRVLLKVVPVTLHHNDVPKVAFSASLGDGLQKTTSGNKVLIYRDVMTNEGWSYNPQTGVFTAPVRGVYLVMFTANAPTDFPLSAVLYRNNIHVELIAHEQQSGAGSDTASNSAFLVLDQGDTLHMVLWHNTQIWDNSNHHSTFSGALLFPLDQNVTLS
uniref:C1q domain-containing protein n=1 Tax=Knipowitschia caucasica TaxID=637954 RepID=A0AAV2ME43_KNICA